MPCLLIPSPPEPPLVSVPLKVVAPVELRTTQRSKLAPFVMVPVPVRPATERSPVVATEFVGTSISSGGDGSTGEGRLAILQSRNPFVKYYNNQRGYVTCELTPDLMRAKYQCVDYVSKPGAPLVTRATFVVENGRPGAKRDS